MQQAKIHKCYQGKYSRECLCKYLATTVSFANIFCKQKLRHLQIFAEMKEGIQGVIRQILFC